MRARARTRQRADDSGRRVGGLYIRTFDRCGRRPQAWTYARAMHVHEWGRRDDVPLLFWHALGPDQSGAALGDVVPALVDSGFHVLSVDGPGFGRSPALEPDDYRLEAGVERLYAVAGAGRSSSACTRSSTSASSSGRSSPGTHGAARSPSAMPGATPTTSVRSSSSTAATSTTATSPTSTPTGPPARGSPTCARGRTRAAPRRAAWRWPG